MKCANCGSPEFIPPDEGHGRFFAACAYCGAGFPANAPFPIPVAVPDVAPDSCSRPKTPRPHPPEDTWR